jgi:hypothetical protein
MRKVLAWVVVTIGIAALVRRLRRRRESEPEPEWVADTAVPAPEGAGGPPPEEAREDPVEELRRKLASSREAAGLADPPAPPGPADSVGERRADVHEQGRAAIDEMQRSSEE